MSNYPFLRSRKRLKMKKKENLCVCVRLKIFLNAFFVLVLVLRFSIAQCFHFCVDRTRNVNVKLYALLWNI